MLLLETLTLLLPDMLLELLDKLVDKLLHPDHEDLDMDDLAMRPLPLGKRLL